MTTDIQEHINAIRNAGYAVKVWSAEDVRSAIEESYEDEDALSPEKTEEVVNYVLNSSHWNTLEDASDYDWMHINMAIDEALENE